MTIKVTITNDDARQDAVIGVRGRGKLDDATTLDSREISIGAGKSEQIVIHANNYVMVYEISDGSESIK